MAVSRDQLQGGYAYAERHMPATCVTAAADNWPDPPCDAEQGLGLWSVSVVPDRQLPIAARDANHPPSQEEQPEEPQCRVAYGTARVNSNRAGMILTSETAPRKCHISKRTVCIIAVASTISIFIAIVAIVVSVVASSNIINGKILNYSTLICNYIYVYIYPCIAITKDVKVESCMFLIATPSHNVLIACICTNFQTLNTLNYSLICTV